MNEVSGGLENDRRPPAGGYLHFGDDGRAEYRFPVSSEGPLGSLRDRSPDASRLAVNFQSQLSALVQLAGELESVLSEWQRDGVAASDAAGQMMIDVELVERVYAGGRLLVAVLQRLH